MISNIENSDKIIDSKCKAKHQISIINQFEFDSMKKKDLTKNKLPIFLTLINNFPNKYSKHFGLTKNNNKTMKILEQQSKDIIKRKIQILTTKYRNLVNKQKKYKDKVEEKFIKYGLLKLKSKIDKLKKLKNNPKKLIRTGTMKEKYVYNDLDEIYYTNIVINLNDKEFGFIYEDSIIDIDCEVIKHNIKTIHTLELLEKK